MAGSNVTGYGPSSARHRLYFDGDQCNYEQWEVKFLGYMKLRKLKDTITETKTDDLPAGFKDKNEECYAELIQFLDNTSLSMVMRDAEDDGRAALNILKSYYYGKSKQRVIALYTQLTTMQKDDSTITEYIIKAEKAAAALKNAGEDVSDSLLIAMMLKGLPDEYKPFTVVVTQRDEKLTFKEFKTHLQSFSETEKARGSESDNVMKFAGEFRGRCYSCGKNGHLSKDCRSRGKQDHRTEKSGYAYKKKWCSFCKNGSHTDASCRKKDSSKSMNSGGSDGAANNGAGDENHTFAFKLDSRSSTHLYSCSSLLVDCGATSHIVTDKSTFTAFDKSFQPNKHYIELADGTREHSIAKARGDASVKLRDTKGNVVTAVLKNALYIPSYPHDIFSVRVATESGANVNFGPEEASLQAADGTAFRIVKNGKLYYFENVDGEVDTANKVCDVMTWHKILGHCNMASASDTQYPQVWALS
jgi:hypothetical protein